MVVKCGKLSLLIGGEKWVKGLSPIASSPDILTKPRKMVITY
jgi:hypothetical protein